MDTMIISAEEIEYLSNYGQWDIPINNKKKIDVIQVSTALPFGKEDAIIIDGVKYPLKPMLMALNKQVTRFSISDQCKKIALELGIGQEAVVKWNYCA